MIVSSITTQNSQQQISNDTEARGMASSPAASAKTLHPQRLTETAAKNQLQISPFPIGGRESGAYEYEEAKKIAVHSTHTARGEKRLQQDSETIRAAAIFSALHLPSDFSGPVDEGWGPLECNIAASPSQLIAATTSAWTVMDKAGEALFACDWAAWFADLKGDDEEVMFFNPKAIYDQNTGRWILVVCAWSENVMLDGLRSYFYIAVSQTRNPLGAWWGWKLNANLNGQELTPYHAASLGVGIDNTALYLTANMFDGAGHFRYAKIRIIDKSQLTSGGEIQWFDFWDLRDEDETPAFGIRPAHTFGAPGVQYFLNATRNGQGLSLWSLRYSLSAEPLLQRRLVSTPEYSLPPNSTQANFNYEIETGDTRIVNCVFRNGVLWAAHTIAANWGEDENRAAIQWFLINPGSGKVTQQRVFGAAGYDYYCPTLMLDGRGNMVMVFNRSGVGEFPAIRFTGRLAIDTVNKLHSSSLLREGSASRQSAWGAYNGAAVDPNDIKIWIIGKYSAGESVGATWIGETSFMSAQPEVKK